MNLLAFGMPGPTEMIIVGIIAVLLFGSRLPMVSRSLGQSLFSFKKGMKEVEMEVNDMEAAATKQAKEIEAGLRS